MQEGRHGKMKHKIKAVGKFVASAASNMLGLPDLKDVEELRRELSRKKEAVKEVAV
jgi:hypothetical protein